MASRRRNGVGLNRSQARDDRNQKILGMKARALHNLLEPESNRTMGVDESHGKNRTSAAPALGSVHCTGRHIPIHEFCRTFPLGVRSMVPDRRQIPLTAFPVRYRRQYSPLSSLGLSSRPILLHHNSSALTLPRLWCCISALAEYRMVPSLLSQPTPLTHRCCQQCHRKPHRGLPVHLP